MSPMDWEFCAMCMGQGRFLEMETVVRGYRWHTCETCIGVGQVLDSDTLPLAA